MIASIGVTKSLRSVAPPLTQQGGRNGNLQKKPSMRSILSPPKLSKNKFLSMADKFPKASQVCLELYLYICLVLYTVVVIFHYCLCTRSPALIFFYHTLMILLALHNTIILIITLTSIYLTSIYQFIYFNNTEYKRLYSRPRGHRTTC